MLNVVRKHGESAAATSQVLSCTLKYMAVVLLVSIHRNLSNDLVAVYSFRIRCRQSRYFPISLVQKGINSGLVIWVLYHQ